MIIELLLWIGTIAFMFFGFWEALALLTKEKQIPTWSRLIRAIWKNDRPELKPVIFVITLTVGFIFTLWLAIHFIV
ncbi:hypothetical protein KA005_34260 [bacterium]|nr:hypothetical protein [bacterium]